MPKKAQEILELFLPTPKRFLQISPNSMFNAVQWFSMLKAGGAYDNVHSPLNDKQEKYAEYFLKSHDKRLELAEEMFENHYDYLTDWYTE